ncbi:MAG: 5'-nucleotidase C-terminal domain-containing protein [Candidatus Kapaibacterium sp.]
MFTFYKTGVVLVLFLFFAISTALSQTRTIHLIHLADAEASTGAIETAPNFAALVDAFVEEGNTLGATNLILSSGDNYLPSPFMSAAGDYSMRQVFRDALGNPNAREGTGYADIRIHNILGVEASAVGNHEFDLGTSTFGELMHHNIRNGSEARYLGAQFPYLSANLDFTEDGSLSWLYTDDALLNTEFITSLQDLANPAAYSLAPSTIIDKGGFRIGVVGATTPIVESISSTGEVTAKQPGGGTNNMQQLAQLLQPYIDELVNDHNIDIIVLLAHMQQLSYERELIGFLSGVDIVIAGGSNSILADNNDRLMDGDTKVDTYPIVTQNKDGDPALIVSTDGGFKYVGRLLVDFDANGVVVPSSIDDQISGAWAADQQSVEQFFTSYDDAFSNPDSRAAKVKAIVDGIKEVIVQKDGNTFGWTDVYLEGRRTKVRTAETNLGNLTADANLHMAKTVDTETAVSLKNGGGIRSSIGEIITTGTDKYIESPPLANPLAGKELGEVSQLDIENSLRFNNALTLITLTAEQLLQVLNHAVAASGPDATPGQFPQVGGVKFTFDPYLEAGSRVKDAWIIDEDGNEIERLAENFQVSGNSDRPIRVVTLNFLVGGGDSYPYPDFEAADIQFFNKVELEQEMMDGASQFANNGTEQDALAEYLAANYSSKDNAFDKGNEGRIVILTQTSVEEIIINDNSLFVYPNPAANSTLLRFNVVAGDYYTLNVFDVLGRNIHTLDLEYLNEGINEIGLSLEHLESGKFYINLRGRDFNATTSISVVR